jgi:PhnB protein
MAIPVEGGCLCGAIRYRFHGTPSSISICHCQSCRRASGAPAVSWIVISRLQFTLLSGNPVAYQSSANVLRGFCGKCGTQLTYEHDSAPDTVELTTASLDQPSAMEPTKEIWLADKLPWVAVNQDLEHHSDESSPANRDPNESSATKPKFIPPGWSTVTPRIIAVDAEPLVEFVKRVFDAAGDYHPQAPAELKLGDSIIMISDAGVRAPTPACLYVYVANADATWQRAIDAGARSIERPADTPYGDRRGIVMDRWGNTWQIATRLAQEPV